MTCPAEIETKRAEMLAAIAPHRIYGDGMWAEITPIDSVRALRHLVRSVEGAGHKLLASPSLFDAGLSSLDTTAGANVGYVHHNEKRPDEARVALWVSPMLGWGR